MHKCDFSTAINHQKHASIRWQGLDCNRTLYAILDTGATCNLWKHRKDLKDIDWNERPSIKGIGGTRSALGVGTR